MEEKYLLSIDQGTTSTRAIIFDKNGNVINQVDREITQYYPHPGWVEHDAKEIYDKTLQCVKDCVKTANLSFEDIKAIGITNQRETVVIWDKKTGIPVYHAIVWQSVQSKDVTDRLEPYKKMIKEKTGLLINPYFSASKIRWLFDTYPEYQAKAENGELLCGTIDCWLLYNLTGRRVHATDYSNASRTLLFNIYTQSWDDKLLSLFNIPKSMLPEVKESSGVFGYLDESITDKKVPISGMAGDQQAALFGQCCYNKGSIKNTYGTGCFTLMNTGSNPISSKYGLLTTIAWKTNGQITYALEGSVFIGGASVQWLRDELKLVKKASETERCAKKACSSLGVYVVPAFTGLGTPYWDDNCRGAIFGLTRGSNRNVIVRATLEAIAYQSKDVIETMKKETRTHINELSVDGGASANNYLMQFQSDILQSKIIVPNTVQTTALGAAYLAGLGVGYYSSTDQIRQLRLVKSIYNPKMDKKEVSCLYKGWKKAVKAAREFE